MYYLNNIEELTLQKLSKIIRTFRGKELPQIEKYIAYYDGKQEILNKYVSDPSKPCNKIVCNYCYDITENYCGYLTGIPITYTSEEDISSLSWILNYNDVHSEDSSLLKNGLVAGVGYELAYLDEMAQQRFKILDSKEVIPIYRNNLEEELIAAVRMYSANDIEDTSKTFVDVYTDKEILHYKSDITFSDFTLLEARPHYYGQVPITVFELNKERKSIFDRIISLQDAYNKLLSASVDDEEAFVDAYMVLVGYNADSEDIEQMKKDRVLLLDEEGAASYLTKTNDDSAVNELLDRINKQILKIAKCPDFTDEAFGTSSGIAIRYKLTGMENNAATIESNLRKALQKRLELISAIQKLTTDELGWRDIEIVFTRNLPINYLEQAQLVNQLRGLVSDKTLLAQLPFVKDVDKELELLAKQNESVLTYNFGAVDNE